MYSEMSTANQNEAICRQEKARLQADVDCLVEDVAQREKHMFSYG